MNIDNLLRDIQESLPADPCDGDSIIIRYGRLANMIRDYDSDKLEAKNRQIKLLKEKLECADDLIAELNAVLKEIADLPDVRSDECSHIASEALIE